MGDPNNHLALESGLYTQQGYRRGKNGEKLSSKLCSSEFAHDDDEVIKLPCELISRDEMTRSNRVDNSLETGMMLYKCSISLCSSIQAIQNRKHANRRRLLTNLLTTNIRTHGTQEPQIMLNNYRKNPKINRIYTVAETQASK